jgi:hypothetical protein
MAKTVFVLGAGASVPYGLPAGCELNDIIRANAFPYAHHVSTLGVDPNALRAFCETVDYAGRTSIDAFLEARRELVDLGKLAIAMVLLPREQTPLLFRDWPQRRLGRVKDPRKEKRGHWYELLFNMLTQGRSFDSIDLSGLGVVTFNYDRSLEHYLFTALANSYGRSPDEVAARLSGMKIVHVHGSLGLLPWQRTSDGKPIVPYGDSSPANVLHARDRIKILHEADQSSADFEEAHSLLVTAKRVYFFGFHKMNLVRLGLPKMQVGGTVGGTKCGLSYDTIEETREFSYFRDNPIRTSIRWQDKDIYDYLYDHVSFEG